MASVLGERATTQALSLLDGVLGRPAVPAASTYYLIVHAEATEFDDAALGGIHAAEGRRSYRLSLTLQLVLLTCHDKASDPEAGRGCRCDIRWRYGLVHCAVSEFTWACGCRCDIRWRYGLGLRLDEDGPDETTICRFRAWLIANTGQGAAFLSIQRWAHRHEVLGQKIDELADTTAVWGVGAVQNTLALLRNARRNLARSLRQQPEQAAWAQQVLAEPDEKPDARWDDHEARRQVLNALVALGQEALARTEGLPLLAEQAQSRHLVQTVLGQDTEPDPDGGVRIREGVAKDRVCSVTDAEMRHGHKTSSGRFDGHQAELGVDRATERIPHVEDKPGNSADAAHLAEKMAETEQAVDVEIARLTGDTAYGRPAVREAMAQRGTAILAPVAAPHNRGLFSKDDLKIDLESRGATCPAGPQGRPTFNKQGELAGFRFQAKTYAICPYVRSARLVSGTTGRSTSVPTRLCTWRCVPNSGRRPGRPITGSDRGSRARMWGSWHHGMRQARCHGLVKTELQPFFTVAVISLQRLEVLCPWGRLPIPVQRRGQGA